MNEHIYNNSRFTLYEYVHSSVPGDHTLTCQIDIGKDSVVWHNFKNFSRIHPQGFDYGDLKFTFENKAYAAAIEALKKDKLNSLYV